MGRFMFLFVTPHKPGPAWAGGDWAATSGPRRERLVVRVPWLIKGALERRPRTAPGSPRARDCRFVITIVVVEKTSVVAPEQVIFQGPAIPRVTAWHDCGDVLTRIVYRPRQWEKSSTAPVPICPGC